MGLLLLLANTIYKLVLICLHECRFSLGYLSDM